jgi:hypothetical protein
MIDCCNGLTYADSGGDIDAGRRLVDPTKPMSMQPVDDRMARATKSAAWRRREFGVIRLRHGR